MSKKEEVKAPIVVTITVEKEGYACSRECSFISSGEHRCHLFNEHLERIGYDILCCDTCTKVVRNERQKDEMSSKYPGVPKNEEHLAEAMLNRNPMDGPVGDVIKKYGIWFIGR